MTVRGIEAIKLCLPPMGGILNDNVKEEKGQTETTTQKGDSPQDALEAAITINPMERYRQEWKQLCEASYENPDSLSDLAFDGHLQTSKFRSVYWSLLLRTLPSDHLSWSIQREIYRKRYDRLKKKIVKNPHQIEGNPLQEDDDPLSQSSKSVWNQYFSDRDLYALIRQDVIRTFPGVDFFRKEFVQEAMINILFFYAREHPDMCYRQGMHEILAPLIFVMYGDHQSFLQFKYFAKNVDIDEILVDVLNPMYLEADCYFLFERIMISIEPYYRISNGIVKKTMDGNNSYGSSEDEETHGTEVEVVGHLNLIRDKLLAKEDLHLHNYLMKLDIPLHIFGIRWLRLLFGREFAFLDLLVLWDAIFADGDRFDLPNYILVAMLIRIRDKLLLSDYTTCLTYLMRYPPNVDMGLILRHALHMQMPKKYDRPSNAFVYFNMPPTTAANQVKSKGNLTNSNQRKSDAMHATAIDGQSSGENAMERQITLMQTRNAVDDALMARLQHSTAEIRLAMDGYKDNTPELMRLELKNVQTVITIARSKLQTYLLTLRRNMSSSGHTSPEITDALDGIEELCQFLDVKFVTPLHSRTAPIDQALEANEQQLKLQQRRQQQKTESFKDNATKRDLDSMPNLSINDTSNPDPNPSSSSQTSSHDHAIAYELPDNGFMLQSSRVLGNVKEIELMTILPDEKVVELRHLSGHSVGNSNSSISNAGLPVADPLSLNNY